MAGIPAPKKIDARKLLRTINGSAQAQQAIYEDRVRKLGDATGKRYRLVALERNSLIFEDVNAKQYYEAELQKQGRRIKITNIVPLIIEDVEKPQIFEKSCRDLVDALSENNTKGAERIFSSIESQRFRSRVIPPSGLVTTRDQITHRIPIFESAVREDMIPRLVRAIVKAVSDDIRITEGRVVEGVFTESQESFKLPINEYTRRRVVAKYMREHAMSAHTETGFQRFVHTVAGHISEGKISKAVNVAARFLREEQEFTLLNLSETRALVDDTLAVLGNFNDVLGEHTALTIFRTNLATNRDDIVSVWRQAAEMSGNATLLENVNILSGSKGQIFEKDYQDFLGRVFNENADLQSVRARAYLATLKVLHTVLTRLSEENEEDTENRQMSDEMATLITRLEGTVDQPDDKLVGDVERLLAGVDEALINKIVTLGNYDQMAAPELGDEEMGAEGEEGGEAVPLPGVEGTPEEEGLGPELGGAPEGGEGMPGEGAPEGEEDGEVPPPPPPPAPEEEEEELRKPKFESKVPSAMPIEYMGIGEMEDELQSWRTSGGTYILEDGYDDCMEQLNLLVRRCSAIGGGAGTIREQFERMRDVLLKTGVDVVLDENTDPYAVSVADLPFVSINDDYDGSIAEDGTIGKQTSTKMDELQGGEGVEDGKAKSAPGDDGKNVSAGGDYKVSGGPSDAGKRMDELQGTEGVQKSSVARATGGKGDGAKSAEDYKASGGPKDAGLRMDQYQDGTQFGKSTKASVAEGRHEGELDVGTGVQGRNFSDTGLQMADEYQGDGGVVNATVASTDCASGGTSSTGSYEASGGPSGGGLDMSDLQGSATVTKQGGKLADKGLRQDDLQGPGGVVAKGTKSSDGTSAGTGSAADPDDDDSVDEATLLFGTKVNKVQRNQVATGRSAYNDDDRATAEDILHIADTLAEDDVNEDVAVIVTTDTGAGAAAELEPAVKAVVSAMRDGGPAPDMGGAAADMGAAAMPPPDMGAEGPPPDMGGAEGPSPDMGAEAPESGSEMGAPEGPEDYASFVPAPPEAVGGEDEGDGAEAPETEEGGEGGEGGEDEESGEEEETFEEALSKVVRLTGSKVVAEEVSPDENTARNMLLEASQASAGKAQELRAKVRKQFPNMIVNEHVVPSKTGWPISENVTRRGTVNKNWRRKFVASQKRSK